MKFLFVFACVALICSINANANQDKTKALSAECMETVKPTAEGVAKFRKGEFIDTDENLKCWAKCVLAGSGFWTDGKPNEAVILEKLGPIFGQERVATAATKCNGIRGANECDSIYKVYQCYHGEKSAIEL